MQCRAAARFSFSQVMYNESCGMARWPVNSNAGTGEKAKEISKSQIPNFPNFLGLVLGCIEASKQASKQGRAVPLIEKEKEKRPRYPRATFASKHSLENSRRDLHDALHRFGIESQKPGKPWGEKNLVQPRRKMARSS